jgi:hypothetical protein
MTTWPGTGTVFVSISDHLLYFLELFTNDWQQETAIFNGRQIETWVP